MFDEGDGSTQWSMRVSADGKAVQLPHEHVHIEGAVTPLGARVWVVHWFATRDDGRPHEYLHVFQLPRRGRVRGFEVRAGDRCIRSQWRDRAEARKTYEDALDEGHLSALAEAHRDGLHTLALGQIRPGERVCVRLEVVLGVDLRDDGLTFRFPLTFPPNYHPEVRAWREGSRGGQTWGEAEGDGLILPEWRWDDGPTHTVSAALTIACPATVRHVHSPSHRIGVPARKGHDVEVVLEANEGDRPNRDFVVDVAWERNAASLFRSDALDGLGEGWVVLVPSHAVSLQAPSEPVPVVIVVDVSGSMAGPPLDAARKAVLAALTGLAPGQPFEIIAFDDTTASCFGRLQLAAETTLDVARRWVRRLSAGGGTRLDAALDAASDALAGRRGEVLLVTDGQAWEEDRLVARARQRGVPVWAVGIGAAAQDRLLHALSVETGADARLVGPRDDVARTTLELFQSMGRARPVPVAEDGARRFEVEGHVWVEGRPLVIWGRDATKPDDIGAAVPPPSRLTLRDPNARGRGLSIPLAEMRALPRGLVPLLWAARRLEVLERVEGTGDERVAERIRVLGEATGLVCSQGMHVAVLERPGDRPGELVTEVLPVSLPEDMHPEGVFGPGVMPRVSRAPSRRTLAYAHPAWGMASPSPQGDLTEDLALFSFEARFDVPDGPSAGRDSWLLEALATLELDGGLPGASDLDRVIRTAVLVLAILEQGEARLGAHHLERMAAFIEETARAMADDAMRRALVCVAALGRAGGVPATSGWRERWEKLSSRSNGDLDAAIVALRALA